MQELLRFMAEYDDEAKCRQFLFQLRWPCGFVCTRCGNDEYCLIHTRNLYQCTLCRHQVSLTSGTMFHNTKLPISYWLFVFHWFTNKEKDCSAKKLSNLLQVHYRTALRMLNIVRHTMRVWCGGNPIMHGDIRWETASMEQTRLGIETQTGDREVDGQTKLAESQGSDRSNSSDIDELTDKCMICGAIVGAEAVDTGLDSRMSSKWAKSSDLVAVGIEDCEKVLDCANEETGSVVDGDWEESALEMRLQREGNGWGEWNESKEWNESDGWGESNQSNEWNRWSSRNEWGGRQPRLLQAYRSELVVNAIRMAEYRMKQEISASYRHVRNWQRYYDERHYRMVVPRIRAGAAVSLLDLAVDCIYYAC